MIRLFGSWLDWRAVLLAAILAIAAALPVITTSIERRDYYFFDVTLTSPYASTTQVFWDIGHGWNEYDSSRQPLKVELKPVMYRYMMPMGRIKALRLDPADSSGPLTLTKAQIVDYRGRLVRAFTSADFRIDRDIERLEINGDVLTVHTTPGKQDPILLLDLPEPLYLPGDAHIWFQLGWPVAWKVFLLGLLLGLTPVAGGIARLVRAAAARAKARPRTTIVLASVLAVVIECHPILFQGRSFASPNNGALMLYGSLPTLPGSSEYMYTNGMGSDTGALLFNHVYYPMMQRNALLNHGELPLWNRFALGGMPMLGQGQSGFGDPVNFISILADGAAWAWDLRFLIARWIFSACLALTVWRLTRHLTASVLVAFGSLFIGFFTYRLNHPATFSVCYAPMILWAWTGLIQATTLRRQGGWLAALMLANEMVMTSGTVKEAYIAIACLNLTGAILLWHLPDAAGRRWRVFGLASAAGAIFILLTAPGWLTFLVALRHSWTVYDQPNAITLPLTQLIGFFDDIFYRQTNDYETVVAPALSFFLLLGVLWWFVNPQRWRTDRAGTALALGGILPFAMVFGIVPAALIMKIPFVANIAHIHNTFSCSLLVIGIVLAGCGFRAAIEQARTERYSLRLVALFALMAGLLVAYFIFPRAALLLSPFFRGYAPALVLAFIALPLGFFWSMRSGRWGALCVVLCIALPLLLWRHCQYGQIYFNQYAFAPGLRADLHAPSPGVEYINQLTKEPGRRVGWGNSLFPAYNIALNWEGLYGVDTLRNKEYHELALEFEMHRVYVWDAANKAEDAKRLVPVHDMMNADYYIADRSSPPLEFPGVEFVKQLDLDIYRSPTAWPRAFFTDRSTSYETTKDFARLIATGDRRPFASFQKNQTDIPALSANLADRTVKAATDYRLTANNTSFVVDAPGPGIAVLTEAYYAHDFRALLDGKPVSYFRVNHAFKGVAIPAAGRHEITFEYWPQHLTLSLWLAAGGAVAALAGAGLIFVRGRPQPGT